MSRQESVSKFSPVNIGFIFLGHIAHIHHAAPIAFELSADTRVCISMFASSRNCLELLKDLSKKYPENRCKIEFLYLPWYKRPLLLLKEMEYLTTDIIKAYTNTLNTFSILVTPHDNLEYFLNRNNRNIKLIASLHGMESEQRFGIPPKYGGYDYYLLPGPARYQHMLDNKITTKINSTIIGYPKFDAVNKEPVLIFKNDRPVVVYAPHWNKDLSSWYPWGNEILKLFAASRKYNLIFAPHVKLFSARTYPIPKEARYSANIYIDTKGFGLVDMTYMNTADIYIGDVSSQICEFICTPRPCVFLNCHQMQYKNRPGFEMWELGDVISIIDDLIPALDSSSVRHRQYQAVQEKYFENRTIMSEISAGKSGATAILEYALSENILPENKEHMPL